MTLTLYAPSLVMMYTMVTIALMVCLACVIFVIMVTIKQKKRQDYQQKVYKSITRHYNKTKKAMQKRTQEDNTNTQDIGNNHHREKQEIVKKGEDKTEKAKKNFL